MKEGMCREVKKGLNFFEDVLLFLRQKVREMAELRNIEVWVVCPHQQGRLSSKKKAGSSACSAGARENLSEI